MAEVVLPEISTSLAPPMEKRGLILRRLCDLVSESTLAAESALGETCMVEGCDAIGEEIIALHQETQDRNHKNNDWLSRNGNIDDDLEICDDITPALVCSKHFEQLISSYYSNLRLESHQDVFR